MVSLFIPIILIVSDDTISKRLRVTCVMKFLTNQYLFLIEVWQYTFSSTQTSVNGISSINAISFTYYIRWKFCDICIYIYLTVFSQLPCILLITFRASNSGNPGWNLTNSQSSFLSIALCFAISYSMSQYLWSFWQTQFRISNHENMNELFAQEH